MAGAYVAKPEADATPPDVPDGWDPDWEHPGPDPPGYTPEYSLSATAGEISDDLSAAVTLNLLDHVTYATDEPGSGVIAWSAAIDGAPINLRFSGGEDYASSIESSYSDIGDYWGAEPTIEFELTEANEGDTIVLTAESTVEGQTVSDTAEITADVGYTATFVTEIALVGYDDAEYFLMYGSLFFWHDGNPYDTRLLARELNPDTDTGADGSPHSPPFWGTGSYEFGAETITCTVEVSAEQWVLAEGERVGYQTAYYFTDSDDSIDITFTHTASYYWGPTLIGNFSKVFQTPPESNDILELGWIRFDATELVDLTA